MSPKRSAVVRTCRHLPVGAGPHGRQPGVSGIGPLLSAFARKLNIHRGGLEHKRFARKLRIGSYDRPMSPRRTPASQPIAVRIADDIRIAIEAGDLLPGQSLPTLADLCQRYRCSTTSARTAIGLLKQQGLITGGRGQAPVVRRPQRRVERSSTRHQIEKDLVLESEATRATRGLAELDMNDGFDAFDFSAQYTNVEADADLAAAFDVEEGTALLRREFAHRDKRTGALAAWSVSWLPMHVIEGNPDIADETKAAWPGGTMHQLYTVGVEVDRVIDQVTAAMPTTVEATQWDLQTGVPLLSVRRISIDTTGRVVEVSDATYPADRTLLTFHTTLNRWERA